jgi:hypothetical protein
MFCHDTNLICPHCRERYSYLHHDQVTVYSRGEDDPKVTKTVVRGSLAEVKTVDNSGSGNPSSRRDGVAIRFWCEMCHTISELTFAQHKGNTLVEWREVGRLADTWIDRLIRYGELTKRSA